ncbi:hypothetical protein PCC8801_0937 [Rippkaea orientalis PCC 8801]|uniref:AraC-type arabinose-binding/dimerisation domain-containing protein n=1 Tax=Rippkaea orientalis (strain PCC 8801 / RF-1) TaxID=41431 RepID=B7JZS1_RIPO1|nr:hypothetical protein [Rippkaea orientalis]ACK65014.1 hypothetical protein PCC8801_0937 [Rippkaea orientalis PCC 8801]
MLLNLLEKLGRKRIIYDRDGLRPYMVRYYLLFRDKLTEDEPAKNLPFNLMLHHICLSDPDDLHDHPWWYATLILKGGYWEITPEGKFWRGTGHFRIRSPESLHRIEIPEGSQGSWSLFFCGTRMRNWGFIKEEKWIDHKQYLEQRKYKEESCS